MAHYYDDNTAQNFQIRQIEHVIAGRKLNFATADGVFSKDKVDFGSHFLIEYLLKQNLAAQKMLDIGCGYGAIGIALALFCDDLTVGMLDINSRALALARRNINRYQLADRVEAVHVDNYVDKLGYYDLVVSNPPIRAGKATVFAIYDKALGNLKQGGTLYVVIQKKQGAASSKKQLTQIFGNCTVVAKRAGYYLLSSVK